MASFIYNITFVMAPDAEREFVAWMKGAVFPSLFPQDGEALSPRLRKVVEAGGEKPGPDHGLSMALHAEFGSEEAAHSWNDNVLPGVLRRFHAKFGPHVAFFTTLLEEIPL